MLIWLKNHIKILQNIDQCHSLMEQQKYKHKPQE